MLQFLVSSAKLLIFFSCLLQVFLTLTKFNIRKQRKGKLQIPLGPYVGDVNGTLLKKPDFTNWSEKKWIFRKTFTSFLYTPPSSYMVMERYINFNFSKFSIAASLMFVARCRFCKNLCFFSNKHAIEPLIVRKETERFRSFMHSDRIGQLIFTAVVLCESRTWWTRCQCLDFAFSCDQNNKSITAEFHFYSRLLIYDRRSSDPLREGFN